ncbi:NitT/TauT family transport system substrate-binding protein [Rhizobiales bacterium GAS191]|nr:NitT/TauT family transport system substrate-binding protein [Rhizobiales bacterium GAS191]
MRLHRGAAPLAAIAFAAIGLLVAMPAKAEKLTVGTLTSTAASPLYIAQENGYFAKEGVEIEIKPFQAAQPIAAAVASGDIDIGATALTAGFYNLAAKADLHVIGGMLREAKGYEGSAILVSNKAFAAGLTDVSKMPGHSLAITQTGSSFHYMIGRIAEKLGFDLSKVQLRVLQTVPNMLAAVQTDQVDAMITTRDNANPLAVAGKIKIIGWVSDYVPYQLTAIFISQKTLAAHREAVARFARAYQHGVNDYREQFLTKGADGKLVYTAATDASIAMINKYVFPGDPDAKAKILAGTLYFDQDAKLDTDDVRNQVTWFKSQGMVDAGVDPDKIIDTSIIPALGK